MIVPTATDILRTIDATIAEKIEPSLSDLTGRSAMATVRHLLRHVMVRIESEGEVLASDITALRQLLPAVRDYLATLESAQARAVDRALAENSHDPTQYRSLAALAAEAGALRECVYGALKYLQGIRKDRGADPAYKTVRAAIRRYLVTQIEEEERLIAPAFFGKGPRR